MPLTKDEFILSVARTSRKLGNLDQSEFTNDERSHYFFALISKLKTLCDLLERKEGDDEFNQLFNKLMGVESNESERNETETTREEDARVQRRNTLHAE